MKPTASVVAQLMSVERAPRTRITLEQAAVTKRQSTLQDIAAKLSALRIATDDLKSAGTWLETQLVSSTDPTRVGARRSGGAAPGGYDVTVTQLAAAERRTYAYQPPAAAGPLQILNGDGTARATISLAAGATVADAAAAINANAGANLYASTVNGQLVLAAKTTGVSSGFSVTGAGAQVGLVAGQDAMFQVGATAYTRSSNVVGDVVPGLELTLKAKTTSAVGITVGAPGADQELVASRVRAFVDAYNAVVTVVRAATGEKRVPKAGTAADAQKGTLFGDVGLQNMLTSLRAAVAAKIAGLSGPSSLADIGVSTGGPSGGGINRDAVDGKLTFDGARLTAALTADATGVRKLLGGVAGTAGFAQKFGTVVATYAGPGGIFESRATSAERSLTSLRSRLETFDARMASKQAFYERRFIALDQAIARSQAVGGRLQAYQRVPAA